MTTNPDNTNNNTSYQNQAYGVPSNDAAYGQNGYGIAPELLATAKKTKTWGLWSIILACIGIFIGIFAWAGIGLAVSAMIQANKVIAAGVPAEQTGKGRAIAGIIVGIAIAVLNLTFIVLSNVMGS